MRAILLEVKLYGSAEEVAGLHRAALRYDLY